MPLTHDQLAHLETRLREERARLVAQLHEFAEPDATGDMQERAGDLSKFPTHPADLGTDTMDEELEASIGSRVLAELSEIDAAIDRLTTSPDTFGTDEQTGAPIPFERLDIIPYARIAVSH